MTRGYSPVWESSHGLKTKRLKSGLRSASGSKAGGYEAAYEAPLQHQLSNYQLSIKPNGRRGNGPPIFSRCHSGFTIRSNTMLSSGSTKSDPDLSR
jgi:hypothetical protein